MPDLTFPLVVQALRTAGCVYAEDEAALLLEAAETPQELTAMVERRAGGEPLEYVVGWAEFCGLRIQVAPSVFVPRRRTEFLVREAAALLAPDSVVVDLCCGSGAVGATLLMSTKTIDLYACDIEPRAILCARTNIGEGGQVFEGDLFEPLPPALHGRVDIMAVNAPYVPSDEVRLMPPEARLHEALVTLDGGSDGLDVQRRIVAEAPRWLAPQGHLLIETSERQAPHTLAEFRSNGLAARIMHDDDLSATVVIGRLA